MEQHGDNQPVPVEGQPPTNNWQDTVEILSQEACSVSDAIHADTPHQLLEDQLRRLDVCDQRLEWRWDETALALSVDVGELSLELFQVPRLCHRLLKEALSTLEL
jgi:hypothetical protein